MTMYWVAIAIAGAMTIGVASQTFAAPVLSNTAALATVVSNTATDVRNYRDGYRRGYRHNGGGAIVGGLALGVIGAVAAEGYYRDRPYEGPYGYRGRSHGYGYYAPGYGGYDGRYSR